METTNTSTANHAPTIPMGSAHNLSNSAAKKASVPQESTAKLATKKDLDHFKRELSDANLAFWRSTKFLADILIDARLSLSPEEFQQLIEEAQLDYSFVCKVIKQGSDFRLNDPANEGILPEAFSARHEIMLMKESTFRLGVKSGIINADCKLADLRKLREQVEGKKPKANKSVKTKLSDEPATDVAPKATPANDSTPPWDEPQPQVEEAAAQAPVNTSALRVPQSNVATGPSTATATAADTAPAKGRIAIVVGKVVAKQHKADVDRLKKGIEALVKDYDFIGAVELEVAA